jgi:hypothetical protein
MTFTPSFCPNCGTASIVGASFCAKCGHDMSATSSGYGSSAPPPAFYPVSQNRKDMSIWKKVGLGVLSLVVVFSLLILAGSAYSLYSRGSSSSPSSDFNANNIAYAVVFNQDYNAMIASDNVYITGQNSSDPKTEATAINARLTLHRKFDTQLLAIDWPPSRTAQQTQVLTADIALEQQLATMAVNTGNRQFYNSLTVDQIRLEQAFETAALGAINDTSGPAGSPAGGGSAGSGGNTSGGVAYYLHWSCGAVDQCAMVMGGPTGIQNTSYADLLTCKAAQTQWANSNTMQLWNGKTGTWCDPSNDPKMKEPLR